MGVRRRVRLEFVEVCMFVYLFGLIAVCLDLLGNFVLEFYLGIVFGVVC